MKRSMVSFSSAIAASVLSLVRQRLHDRFDRFTDHVRHSIGRIRVADLFFDERVADSLSTEGDHSEPSLTA